MKFIPVQYISSGRIWSNIIQNFKNNINKCFLSILLLEQLSDQSKSIFSITYIMVYLYLPEDLKLFINHTLWP